MDDLCLQNYMCVTIYYDASASDSAMHKSFHKQRESMIPESFYFCLFVCFTFVYCHMRRLVALA